MDRALQLVGESAAFLDAVERASRAAAMNRPVLVVGERGTGKELIAERLHRLSPRWQEPLVTMNCAALPETLIEAELFGHEAGAFTGATRARAGRFEEADRGTLFLDELATLSSGAQERLLRAVEYGEVTRIGASRPLRLDVRIVAATNEDLPGMAREGRFRADLLDRLSFEVITLPPLRARHGDVAVLADHYGRRMASELGWDAWPGFAEAALAELEAYAWPGNVRELRNVVERAVYRCERRDGARGGAAPVADIVFDPFASPWQPMTANVSPEFPALNLSTPAEPAPGQPVVNHPSPTAAPVPRLQGGQGLRAAVDLYEKQLLEQELARSRYNQRQTALALGLTYDQLRHALKRHGLAGRTG